MTRGEMKMYEEMRRKSLIRDTLSDKNLNNILENNTENNLYDLNETTSNRESINLKRENIKDFDNFTNILKEAKIEIKNVKKKIEECKESKLKYELNQYLAKRITKLEKLILDVKNSLN